jgi:hypothetical protein
LFDFYVDIHAISRTPVAVVTPARVAQGSEIFDAAAIADVRNRVDANIDAKSEEAGRRSEGQKSTKRARRMTCAQERGVAVIKDMSSAITGWARFKIGSTGKSPLNSVFDDPASEAAPAKHSLFSAKFKAYDILCRNVGVPGTTVMAVGYQLAKSH